MPALEEEEAARVAGIEINAHAAAGTLPIDELVGAAVSKEPTPIHDINGEVLFYRIPLVRGRRQVAVADIAAHDVLGDPLLAVSAGLSWRPDAIIGEAREQARRQDLGVERADEVRFVAYSYPKVAVQFLVDGQELALLEWMTWQQVPPRDDRDRDRRPLEPANFERWSVIDEMPEEIREQRSRQFRERLDALFALNVDLDPLTIYPDRWRPYFVISLVDVRELAYSPRTGDHAICYELRGQETNVWCVGASTQMLLDFYRYEYTQSRLAQELGLGTLANPNGLPYSQVAKVVTAIETLTTKGLDATMITGPGFDDFRLEIQHNRPLISFVPGHSRTVAGYREALIAPIYVQPYRGLLVYDPWPPGVGVVTRWENFATQIYQFAYSAHVRKV